MIGIFLKELRENLKWAMLIFGIVSLMVYFRIRNANPTLMYQIAQDTVFLAPLAGLLMGVVQTLFETRPDNWAFVVHRPVSRGAIFIGKCVAGLLLLYTSLELPCLIAAAFAARPGNLPIPFQGRMLMPAAADVFNAGGYYFAAMVVTLRKARWYGSRLLVPALAMINTGVILVMISPFWQVLLLCLIVQCVGALAAWGAFASAGDEIVPKVPRFALGILIFTGALGVAFFLGQFPGAFATTTRWQYYAIDRDGNLLHLVWTVQGDQRSSTILDIAGHPVPGFEGVDPDNPAYADRFVQYSASLFDRNSYPWPFPTVDNYRSGNGGVIRLRAVAPLNARMPVLCYFNMQERIIELYDPVTHVGVGTVGPAGFLPAHETPTQRFNDIPLNPGRQANSRALVFPTIVYWMELDQHRVRPIFQAAPDDPIFSAAELGLPGKPMAIIAQRSGLHLVAATGEVVSTIPIQLDPARNYLQVHILAKSNHLLVQFGLMPDQSGDDNLYLEFAADGTLVRKTQLPPLADLGGVKVVQSALLGCIYPLGALPIYKAWLIDSMFDIRTRDYPKLFRGCMFGSAILSLIVTILLGRRFRFGIWKLAGWSAANFLLGPAGVAVLLSLCDWPRRVICAACGARRLAKTRNCSECGAQSPAPAPDGREIFEPVDSFQPAL